MVIMWEMTHGQEKSAKRTRRSLFDQTQKVKIHSIRSTIDFETHYSVLLN